MVDSKDAKKFVRCKSGEKHLSRTNAVTPMTHLFMNTIITEQESIVPNPALQNLDINFEHTSTVLHVTRSGKAVTLVNSSLN